MVENIIPLSVRNGQAEHHAQGMLTEEEFRQLMELRDSTGDSRSRVVATAVAVYYDLYRQFVNNPDDTTNPLRIFFQRKLR